MGKYRSMHICIPIKAVQCQYTCRKYPFQYEGKGGNWKAYTQKRDEERSPNSGSDLIFKKGHTMSSEFGCNMHQWTNIRDKRGVAECIIGFRDWDWGDVREISPYKRGKDGGYCLFGFDFCCGNIKRSFYIYLFVFRKVHYLVLNKFSLA